MARMRFVAEVNNKQHVVDVNNLGNDDGIYHMTLDGVVYNVDAQLMRSHIVSMLINNESYDVDLESAGRFDDTLDGRMNVRVRGRVVRLEVLDERRKKMKEAATAHFSSEGAAGITSPMPGKVMKVLVSVGDSVTMGQGVVIVEAMKMENEFKATKDGTVTSVLVKEGETIESGKMLIVIE